MLENSKYNNEELLLKKIEEADAIMVGGASGMSAAAGYIWYTDNESFRHYFGSYAKKYGIDSIFNGFYYRYRTREERWGYIASLMHFVNDCKIGQPYLDLYQLIHDKNYYIVTTNQDTQFSQVFPEEKVSTIQGDWGYLQCSHCCHDKVYPAMDLAEKMYASIEGTTIPTEMIPICPKCGQDMEPWVRSYVFLEGTKYKEEYEKWNQFLLENKDKKILFLELGVGRMTPMFIQEPFWNMTYAWPNAYYITINPKDALVPRELEQKGMAIKEDIASVLSNAVKLKKVKA